MSLVTLEEVKLHLRIKHDLEDSNLTIGIGMADDHVLNYCNLDELPDPAPDSMKSAALLLVGDFYANKEAQSEKELYKNNSVENLLYPYRECIGI